MYFYLSFLFLFLFRFYYFVLFIQSFVSFLILVFITLADIIKHDNLSKKKNEIFYLIDYTGSW